jgi:hypothetical protein
MTAPHWCVISVTVRVAHLFSVFPPQTLSFDENVPCGTNSFTDCRGVAVNTSGSCSGGLAFHSQSGDMLT